MCYDHGMTIVARHLLFLALLFLPMLASDQLTVQLQWKNQFQFAGFYIAKEMGFYEEVGLDVTLKEIDGGLNVVDEVLNGNAQYGVGRSSLLLYRAQGAPVVALAAIFQDSPSVLLSVDPSIRAPADLRGKRVMMTTDEAESAAIMAMLMTNGVRRDELQLQPHSFDYRDLVSGKTDAMACYISNEPFLLSEERVAFHMFNPKDYGFDFYGDILFTTEQELRQHPERVRRFFEATMRGWQWAFDHIEESARLILERYNTQGKSLDALIAEGNALASLAHAPDGRIGAITQQRFARIAELYRLSGLLQKPVDLDAFVNPLHLGQRHVRIGILAKRGHENTLQRWQPLIDYLNNRLPQYYFKAVPLEFNEFEGPIVAEQIDFIFTNTMFYVQLEHRYGVSRIATLLNAGSSPDQPLKHFGGVIFTRAGNGDINRLEDLKGHTFAAVHPRSFGGWMMAYEELADHGIDPDTELYVSFQNTHDKVVYSVLDGTADAGTVRTDTLERMAREGHIDLDAVKVLGLKQYDRFPYLVSTRLYPEWPIAKLRHTPDRIAHDVVAALIDITPDSPVARETAIGGWTVPVDYSSVHAMLRKLKMPPYNLRAISFADIYAQYSLWIYLGAMLFIIVMVHLFHTRRTNRFLQHYNLKLDREVTQRTRALAAANEKLKELARTDPLTGIHNRLYFMEVAEKYYGIALRNGTPMQALMLDVDHFKLINDSFGHQCGDEILKLFADTIRSLLRRSDLFGRIGGEEFAIILQNTSLDGAHDFAQRLRQAIEDLRYRQNGDTVTFTVSIGIAEHRDDTDFKTLMSRADEALYKAKEQGRNTVCLYEKAC